MSDKGATVPEAPPTVPGAIPDAPRLCPRCRAPMAPVAPGEPFPPCDGHGREVAALVLSDGLARPVRGWACAHCAIRRWDAVAPRETREAGA